MNVIRPYNPTEEQEVVTVTTSEHIDYQRGIIPHYPVRAGDQHCKDEEGRKFRTGPGWWWAYHYGTNQYFTFYTPTLDAYEARMTAMENGWQFEGGATWKC